MNKSKHIGVKARVRFRK